MHTTVRVVHAARHGQRSFSSASAARSGNEGLATRLLAWYSNKLDTHPLLTKGITSGLIAAVGDIMCQSLVQVDDKDRKEKGQETGAATASGVSADWEWDPARTGRFLVLGAFLVAPCIHQWYGFLSRTLPGTSVGVVVRRVALDQLVFTPAFLPVWMSSLWALEELQTGRGGGDTDGKITTKKSIPSRIMQELPTILVANWGLWTPANLINFRFVPLKYQVLYNNSVALFWNVYLSYRTS